MKKISIILFLIPLIFINCNLSDEEPVQKDYYISFQNKVWIQNNYTAKNFNFATMYCDNLGYRLPTISELHSIVNFDRVPTTYKAFNKIKQTYYWSSNNSDSSVIVIQFKNGTEQIINKYSHTANFICIQN